MSSILKISPLNLLNFTTLSTKSPDAVFYMCKQCRDKRSFLPRERRSYSTHEYPYSSTAKSKKPFKRLKKYAELVKVTEDRITQRKIRIGKLTAQHVEAFVEQPGMTLKILKKPLNKKSCLNEVYNKKLEEFQEKINHYKSLLSKGNEMNHATGVPNLENFKNKKSRVAHASGSTLAFSSNLNQPNAFSDLNKFGNEIGNLKNQYSNSFTQENAIKLGVENGDVENPYTRESSKDMTYSKLKKLKQDQKNKLMPLNIDYLNKRDEEENSYWKSNMNKAATKDVDLFNHNEMEKKISRQNNVSNVSQNKEIKSPESSKAQFKAAEVLEFEEGKKYTYKEFAISYVDVCINSGMIETAYQKMKSEIRSTNFSKNVKTYNRLLHGYSRQGNWQRVEEILHIMGKKGIKLNIQSYAAIFDCLGNMVNSNNEGFVRNQTATYLQKLRSEGYHFNDLFYKTLLINDQREVILRVINSRFPDYKIPKEEIQLNSNCELLELLQKICEPYKTQAPEEITTEMLHKLIEEQLGIENNFVVKVKSVVDPKNNIEEKTEQLFKEWKPILLEGFIRSVKIADQETNRASIKALTPYLNCLPAETYVDCMLYELRRVVSDYEDVPAYLSSWLLGSKIWQRYTFNKKKNTGEYDKLINLYKKWADWYLSSHGSAANGRQYWQMLLQDNPEGPHINLNVERWPMELRRDIGDFLYRIMINDCKFNVNMMREKKIKPRFVPVFYTKLAHEKEKQVWYLKFHPTLQKLFQAFNCKSIMFDSDQIPMVCPPKPWSHVNSGGYVINDTMYMRPIKGVKAKTLPYDKMNQEQLYPSFDALNQLQSVPWKVNGKVLDVALTVFKLGGSEELEVPSLPDMTQKKLVLPKDLSNEAKMKLIKENQKMIQQKSNEYGLWCEALYKLSLANHYRKRIIWLPQNMDFRGRVYPVPPHFNHLSADLYRSLLIFAKGEPLGPKGLDWLKIHAINLTGTHKKQPISERLKYANEILDKILDSAENPLTGEMWWKKSDEPWQTLAACMEIKQAMEHPNPDEYVSHFPVHQDGSCNGLQHYAALGRDVIGAKSVNVSPSDSPQDVYSCVLSIVEEKRKADAANDVKIAQVLEGFVARKVIKQTVMTTVYGVTPYGAKLQILRQLEYLKDFDQNYGKLGAAYLSQKVFESLNEMFTSATEIQEWFVACANVISRNGQDYVKWVTPLGLPVVQPYAKQCKVPSKSGEKSRIIVTPNVMKQKNAFPPNFVHSLDSSHMMLTAMHCEQAGITFAAVHDCFWTHPCNVEIMNKICRDQFVALHSQPILEKVAEQFREYYKALPPQKREIFEKIPRTGNLDLNSVLDSVYFFS